MRRRIDILRAYADLAHAKFAFWRWKRKVREHRRASRFIDGLCRVDQEFWINRIWAIKFRINRLKGEL